MTLPRDSDAIFRPIHELVFVYAEVHFYERQMEREAIEGDAVETGVDPVRAGA
jgi:hypothetical protein